MGKNSCSNDFSFRPSFPVRGPFIILLLFLPNVSESEQKNPQLDWGSFFPFSFIGKLWKMNPRLHRKTIFLSAVEHALGNFQFFFKPLVFQKNNPNLSYLWEWSQLKNASCIKSSLSMRCLLFFIFILTSAEIIKWEEVKRHIK